MIKILGLWEKKTQDEKLYLRGKALKDITIPKGTKIFIYKNKEKFADTDPDYSVYIEEN